MAKSKSPARQALEFMSQGDVFSVELLDYRGEPGDGYAALPDIAPYGRYKTKTATLEPINPEDETEGFYRAAIPMRTRDHSYELSVTTFADEETTLGVRKAVSGVQPIEFGGVAKVSTNILGTKSGKPLMRTLEILAGRYCCDFDVSTGTLAIYVTNRAALARLANCVIECDSAIAGSPKPGAARKKGTVKAEDKSRGYEGHSFFGDRQPETHG